MPLNDGFLVNDPDFRRVHPGLYSTKLGRLQRRLEATPVRFPKRMSNPPTVTKGADQAVSVLPSSRFYAVTDPSFSLPFTASKIVGVNGALNDSIARDYFKGASIGTGTDEPLHFEFEGNIQRMELNLAGSGYVTVLLDGEIAAFSSFTVTGSTRYLVLYDFSDYRHGRFEVIAGASYGCAGVFIDRYATIYPPAQANRPKLVVTTDSYGQVLGTLSMYGLGFETGLMLGSCATLVDCVGGTGYVQQNGGSNNFLDRANIANRQGFAPDIDITLGGINDASGAAIASNAASYFALRRGWWPDAVLVATGPWCPDGTKAQAGAEKFDDIRDAIRTALQGVAGPWVFIDNLTDSWINSSGASFAGSGKPWQEGTGKLTAISFTAALVAATSGTLSTNWAGTTGSYSILFSDGSVRPVTLTNGSAAVSWTGAVTASASAFYGGSWYNSGLLIGTDGTHPASIGIDHLAKMLATRTREAILAL